MKPPLVPEWRVLLIRVAMLAFATVRPGLGELRPDSRRQCTICHLEWVETFNRPDEPLLVEKPTRPTAIGSKICLSCHDGSVVDSRYGVWLEHSHKTGVAPPASMTVPVQWPLEDGKVTCHTCHTAHATPGQDELAAAFFLRVPSEPGQFCQTCHADKAGGPTHGSHPVGGMPWPIPQALIDAGARAKPGQREIHCQVCHKVHGSRRESLLVMGVADNQLCLTCHEKLRPGMWRPARKGVHPDRPVIQKGEQIHAINRMGTRIGQGNRLICLSCHKLHHGKSGRFMLAEPLVGSALCKQCHPDKESLLGTTHNLRRSVPDARNRLGMTPEESGPCGSCHMFHNLAVTPRPSDADPIGICLSCHSAGGLAYKEGDRRYTHPRDTEAMACQTCHDPHEGSHPNFLVTTHDKLCHTCHAEISDRITGGPHHAKPGQPSWPTPIKADSKCAACHQMHSSDPNTKLWTFAPAKTEPTADAICRGCHAGIEWPDDERGVKPKAVMHPRAVIESSRAAGQATRSGASRPADRMACLTCHDPHIGARPEHLLRAPDSEHPASVCVGCHKDAGNIDHSMHSRRALGLPQQDSRVCGPCHAVHAVKGSVRDLLWANKLSPEGRSPSEERCLGCHGPGGTATAPTIIRHPEGPLKAANWGDLLGPDLKSEGIPAGQINCLTCHLPHGRADQQEQRVSQEQRAAAKPMVRRRVAQRLCALCHGFDAIRRYLYYHFPEKRR